MPKIIAFAGSARKDSFNKKLINAAAAVAEAEGLEVDIVDFGELSIPLYDGDMETAEGQPESVKLFRERLREADGILISAPEYNGFITPLLKNVLDWASRPAEEGEPSVYAGKVAAIISASPGPLGGLRGLPFVRLLLSNLGCLVVPEQFALGAAFNAFDDQGNLSDEKQQASVTKVIKALAAAL